MAHDGEAATAAAADAFRPEVMLLDIGLPLLNGYEVCRRLREQPWGGQIDGRRPDRLGRPGAP